MVSSFLKLVAIIFVLLLSAPPVTFGQCGIEYSPDAKICPTSGTTLLDETYPIAAYVISVGAFNRNQQTGVQVASQFILQSLQSYDFAPSSPPIVVPANPVDFAALRKELQRQIDRSGGRIPRSVLDKVVPTEAPSYTWQQDYFESFVNPQTGRPVLRQLSGYGRRSFQASDITKSTGSCDITSGPPLSSNPGAPGTGKTFGSGEMGGNIEGLPGGLCLVGDNLASSVSSEFCGGAQNVVQTNVSWLEVGHVDEVMKVVPTNRPGIPAECNFTLMFASPRKALELLQQPGKSDHPLFSGDFLSDGASKEDLEAFRASRSADGVGRAICEIQRRHPLETGPKDKTGAPIDGSRVFLRLREILLGTANAASDEIDLDGERPCQADRMTVGQFIQGLNEPDHRAYNEQVQLVMDENKRLVTDRILERLPQCRQHLSIMDVPNLFYGHLGTNSDGSRFLPKPGNGGSFMPNPTNSVVAKNQVIFSDPQTPLFRDYLTTELRSVGVRSSYIDTWDYAHRGDGNLHCSSHSISYCSPVRNGR